MASMTMPRLCSVGGGEPSTVKLMALSLLCVSSYRLGLLGLALNLKNEREESHHPRGSDRLVTSSMVSCTRWVNVLPFLSEMPVRLLAGQAQMVAMPSAWVLVWGWWERLSRSPK